MDIDIRSEIPPHQQARLQELQSWLDLARIAMRIEEICPEKIHRVMNRLLWGNPEGPEGSPAGDEITRIMERATPVASIPAELIDSLPGVREILRRQASAADIESRWPGMTRMAEEMLSGGEFVIVPGPDDAGEADFLDAVLRET